MKNFLASLFASIAVCSQAYAFDAKTPYDEVLKNIPTYDCSVQHDECRYLAGAEYVAFAKACPKVFKEKFGMKNTGEKEIGEHLLKWKAIDIAPGKRDALLSIDNAFVNHLSEAVFPYLMKSPSDDVGIECSRVGYIINDEDAPEDMSDILSGTKNFNAWSKERNIRVQQRFDEAQRMVKKRLDEEQKRQQPK